VPPDDDGIPATEDDSDKLERLCAAIRAIDIDILLSEEAWR
jgi:hypothetical protein